MILVLKNPRSGVSTSNDVRRCPVCEGILPNARFDAGEYICRICKARLKSLEAIEFGKPGHKTIRQAYFDLLVAIRKQAILDEALEEWETYWLYSEPWPRIWELLKKAEDEVHTSRAYPFMF